jgi:hypothetical protein
LSSYLIIRFSKYTIIMRVSLLTLLLLLCALVGATSTRSESRLRSLVVESDDPTSAPVEGANWTGDNVPAEGGDGDGLSAPIETPAEGGDGDGLSAPIETPGGDGDGISGNNDLVPSPTTPAGNESSPVSAPHSIPVDVPPTGLNGDSVPTEGGNGNGDGSPAAPIETPGGDGDGTSVNNDIVPSPAPAENQSFSTPAPTREHTSPVSAPHSSPVYVPPTKEPTEEYLPPDDDPINTEEDEKEQAWSDDQYESLEQMEKDRNVQIALGVVFGLGILMTIITAQQMIENPEGCCARYVFVNGTASLVQMNPGCMAILAHIFSLCVIASVELVSSAFAAFSVAFVTRAV